MRQRKKGVGGRGCRQGGVIKEKKEVQQQHAPLHRGRSAALVLQYCPATGRRCVLGRACGTCSRRSARQSPSPSQHAACQWGQQPPAPPRPPSSSPSLPACEPEPAWQ
eukprot:631335-Rhodomonas_salina.2